MTVSWTTAQIRSSIDSFDSSTMGLTQKALKNLVEGAIAVGTGLALVFVSKLFLFSMVIAGIVVVGIGAVVIRYIFFLMLPTLIRFCVPLT